MNVTSYILYLQSSKMYEQCYHSYMMCFPKLFMTDGVWTASVKIRYDLISAARFASYTCTNIELLSVYTRPQKKNPISHRTERHTATCITPKTWKWIFSGIPEPIITTTQAIPHKSSWCRSNTSERRLNHCLLLASHAQVHVWVSALDFTIMSNANFHPSDHRGSSGSGKLAILIDL